MKAFDIKNNATGLKVLISGTTSITAIPDEVIDLIATYLDDQLDNYLSRKTDK